MIYVALQFFGGLMKRIIINGKFLTQRVTGVQRYAIELVNELDKIVQKGEFELAVPPNLLECPTCKNIEVVQVGKLKSHLWEQISFPLYVMKQKAISLNLCNVSPLVSPGIVCIHDMKVKATPQYFSKTFLLWYKLLFLNAIKRSKVVFTVSKFSKKEILKYYRTKPDKIHVVPNAWQHYERITYDENALKKYRLQKDDYCFAMSSLEPNKNFAWIANLAQQNPSIDFAIAGSINEKVFADGLGFEVPSNMKLLGYVSDEEAKTLMRDCKAFLFPSFYEGFGIPPLEAMSAGAKKIVVSDIEVMREVFEEMVYYINPYSKEAVLKQLLSSVVAKSENILNKYSWEKSAQRLYERLKEVE